MKNVLGSKKRNIVREIACIVLHLAVIDFYIHFLLEYNLFQTSLYKYNYCNHYMFVISTIILLKIELLCNDMYIYMA